MTLRLMKQLLVNISEKQKQYSIFIGEDLIEKIPSLINIQDYSKIIIISDDIVEKLFLDKVKCSLNKEAQIIVVEAGESMKNISTIQSIWQQLFTLGCDRKSLIINLGGGVIGDMGGFAASTYMRGIDFLQISTTLLAAVDASIGGKTGIDFLETKNLIGSFRQPIGVIIDITAIKTLPEREFLSGFAEIIKHGLILDKEYFSLVTSKKPQEFTQEELTTIITRSCEIKKAIVEEDEKEVGKRKLVNFGHTIGHAIESLSWETDHPLKHGEAIHIGMLVETRISNNVGLLSADEANIIEKTLRETGLPTSIDNLNVNIIVNIIVNDKKNTNGQINWVLLKHIGEAAYDQQVDEKIVREAIESTIK